MPTMTIAIDNFPADSVVVVRPVGDIDLDTATDLRESLIAAREYGPKTIVVDLAEVGFMDSTGLGQIAWMAGRERERQAALVVANVRSGIRNAMRVLGLDQFIDVVEFGAAAPWPGAVDTTGRAPWS